LYHGSIVTSATEFETPGYISMGETD